MKNTNKLNLSLAGLALLVPLFATACNSTDSLNGVNFNEILTKLESGFTLDGVVIQQRDVVDLAKPGDVQHDEQGYNVKVLYEVGERIGTSITHYGQLGDYETIIDDIHGYSDKQGYVYKEYLDYKNEVQQEYTYEKGNKLSFAAAGLSNFISMFSPNDFRYDNDAKLYLVNMEKMGYVLNNLLTRVNQGFMYTPKSAVLTLKDNMFDTLSVEMEDYVTESFEDRSMIRTTYHNKVDFTFKDVGTTVLPRITSYPSKPENIELKQALGKIKDNMTLDVESDISIDMGAMNKTYQTFKFDGKQILVHNYHELKNKDVLNTNNHYILKTLEGSQSDDLYCYVLDEKTNTYKKDAHRLFAQNYQGVYYYDQLLPKPGLVSTDFFTYDADANEYICNDGDVVERFRDLFLPSLTPLANEHALNSSRIGIRLDGNGDLSYIKYYVKYQNLFNNSLVSGTIKVNYNEIGSTTI